MKGTVILNISYVSVLLWQMLDWNWMITGMKSEWDPTQQLQGPAHTSEFSGGLCWESAWLDIKTSAFTKSWDSLSSFLFGIAAHTSVIFICWSWMRSTDISLLNKSTKFPELNYEGLFKESVKAPVHLSVPDKSELRFL